MVSVDDDMSSGTENRKDENPETKKSHDDPAQPPTEGEFELPTNEEEFESNGR